MRKVAIIWTIAFTLLLLYGSIRTVNLFQDYMNKQAHGQIHVR